MKGIFPALCTLTSLISVASSLKCTVCSVMTKTRHETPLMAVATSTKPECEGATLECHEKDEVCASIYVSSTKYDYTKEAFFKRDCLPVIDCNVSESISTPGMKISYSITCCNTTEGCMPVQPVLKEENTTKNGVLCPACYSDEQPCTAKNSMRCTGDEKYCIQYQKKIPFGNIQIYSSGCATKQVCQQNRTVHFLSKPKNIETNECKKVISDSNQLAGNFIWCNICHDYNVDNCTDLPYLCSPNEDVCLFERTRSIYDGRDDIVIIKRCGKSSECNRAGSIRSSTKAILMNTTCCGQNICHPPLPSLLFNISDANGLVCPACFVPNSDRCLGRSDLKCAGNEKRCIHYKKTEKHDLSTVTESLYGCTTDPICEAGSSLTLPKGHIFKTIKTDIVCSSAIVLNSAAYGLLTIAFSVLYVFKFGY